MRMVTDIVDPAELIEVVRALEFPEFALSAFLPARPVEDIRWRAVRNKLSKQSVAPFRAYDAESPIGARPGLEELSGKLPPISIKIPLTEHERLQLEALYRDVDERLVDGVYDDSAAVIRMVQARIELARGEALTTGAVTINENGLIALQAQYTIPASHLVAPATPWSTVATADVLGDLLAWQEIYSDTNGEEPGVILTTGPVVANMLRNAAFRQIAGSVLGTPSIVARNTLDAILEAHGLPPIRTYNRKVINAAGVETRIIPADRLLLLPDPEQSGTAGEVQFGTTAEALELAKRGLLDASEAPGVVAVVYAQEDPVTLWTKGAAIALPVLHSPERVLSADVQ